MVDTPYKIRALQYASQGAGASRSFFALPLDNLWQSLGVKTPRERRRAALVLAAMAVALAAVFATATLRVSSALKTGPEHSPPVAAAAASPAPSESSESSSLPLTSAKLKDARSVNGDVIGWLTLEGADIDDPVVQAFDNDFYLRRRWNEEGYDAWGCYFLDYMNNASARSALDRVTVIYGHALDDYAESEKFSKLKRYKSADFCKANPTISFSLLEEELSFEVFSVCDIPISIDYIDPRPDDAKYAATLDYMLANSYYDFGVSAALSDKILVLSTCTSDDSVRFIVAAKLL